MFLILACLFLARRYGTSAAPVTPSLADSLAYNAPIFTRDECSNDCSCPGRTVWDIFWGCLATTFAVTWVSVHPNVPCLEEKSWPLLKRRIFLMYLALLAPEVMIMWAFKQWRGAVIIREIINKARPRSCLQWTMRHAHFLQMGGFKVNYVEDDDFFSWPSSRYETNKVGIVVQESVLSFDEFQELLQKQLINFPDTTAKEIEDRSKGDALSKGVALLQITWFIIQLIARAHQHLMITEIELTTAALAGLNSIMYLFWWSKPLDVRCPIIIRTKELDRQLVERAMRANEEETEGSGKNESGNESETGGHTDHAASDWTFSEDDFRLRDYLRESVSWCLISGVAQAIISSLTIHLRTLAMWVLQTIRGTKNLKVIDHEIDLQSSTNKPEDTSMTRSEYRRAMINSILRTCKLIVTKLFYLPYLIMFLPMDEILRPSTPWNSNLGSYIDAKDKMHTKPALKLLFDESDMKWIMSMMFHSEKAETRPLLIFSALAGAAFGSIHCAAWHFTFPSPVERIFWRTASLSIVGVCLCIVGGIPIHNFMYNKWKKAPYSSSDRFFWENVRRDLETIPAIVYQLSRLSLLILALISLRNLPEPAFETATWMKFIPHI